MSTRKSFVIANIALIVIALCYSPLYSGIRVAWSMNAMAFVPTQKTLQSNIAFQVAGKVTFQEGKIGTITLICPLSSGPLIPETQTGTEFVIKQLSLTYRDGDAEGSSGVVSATLRIVNKETGHVSNLENVSSNAPGAPNSGPKTYVTHGEPKLNTGAPMPGINHKLNLNKYFYYIQITLKRTNPNIPVAVMGVTLSFG